MSRKNEVEEQYNEQYKRIFKTIFSFKPTPEELAALLVLHFHDFNEEHPLYVYPSIERIREYITIDKEKLSDVLQCLNDAGIITIGERKRPRGKPMNDYTLTDWENTSEVGLGAFKKRIKSARIRMKAKRKERNEKRREKRGESNPFTTVGQSDHNTGELPNHIIDEQIGFKIAVQPSYNTVNHSGHNMVEQPGQNINNFNTNNLKQISEYKTEPYKNNKNYKIIKEINVFGHKYKFRDDGIVWEEYSKKEWNAKDLSNALPDEHEVKIEIDNIYNKTR